MKKIKKEKNVIKFEFDSNEFINAIDEKNKNIIFNNIIRTFNSKGFTLKSMDITNSYDYLDYEDKFRIILLNKIKLDYSKFNFTDYFNRDIINGEPKITCNNLIINNYLEEETEENNIFYYEKEKEILINSKNLVKRKDDNDNFIFNKYETYSYNNYFYKNCFINTNILKKKIFHNYSINLKKHILHHFLQQHLHTRNFPKIYEQMTNL